MHLEANFRHVERTSSPPCLARSIADRPNSQRSERIVGNSDLCQNFASETIGGCLRTASCTVGRSFAQNLKFGLVSVFITHRGGFVIGIRSHI